MISKLSSPEPQVVERQAQIEEFCQAVRGQGRFAFDTEFVMEDRFEPEVCLLQLATADSVAIIDPFLKLDLAPVWELVCDPKVETIVHAGQEDLALTVQHTGKEPRNIFDLQLAAGLAGYDYPLSLQRLAQLTLHVRLYKSKTLTDWRKRPLSKSQLRYAAEDVCYLPAMRENLHQRLKERGRVDWAREEFARFEDPALYRRVEAEKLARLKGSGALSGRQLAVLRDLVAWREELAETLNRPIRAVLKDHLMVEIARLGLRSRKEVRDLRGLNLAERHVRKLCAVVEAAMATPSDQWPVPPPREIETASISALVALATAVIRSSCHEQGIAYGLAASKRSISQLVRHVTGERRGPRSSIELLKGWRRKAIGAMLQDVLSGRRIVCVHEQDGERVLRVMATPEEDPA